MCIKSKSFSFNKVHLEQNLFQALASYLQSMIDTSHIANFMQERLIYPIKSLVRSKQHACLLHSTFPFTFLTPLHRFSTISPFYKSLQSKPQQIISTSPTPLHLPQTVLSNSLSYPKPTSIARHSSRSGSGGPHLPATREEICAVIRSSLFLSFCAHVKTVSPSAVSILGERIWLAKEQAISRRRARHLSPTLLPDARGVAFLERQARASSFSYFSARGPKFCEAMNLRKRRGWNWGYS